MVDTGCNKTIVHQRVINDQNKIRLTSKEHNFDAKKSDGSLASIIEMNTVTLNIGASQVSKFHQI